jgi:tRNA U34 5-carboxymethylaminomethyl modifying enzyme MnmG/GidA
MFEAKLNDLTAQNDELRQRLEQNERETELIERTHQSRFDELTQNLQQEKSQFAEIRTKYTTEKEKAEQLQRQVKRNFIPSSIQFASPYLAE